MKSQWIILTTILAVVTSINVYQERDFFLLQLQSNMGGMRWTLHELWANLDQLKSKREKKTKLKEVVISLLEDKLIRCTRELKRYLSDDTLSVDYISKKKTSQKSRLKQKNLRPKREGEKKISKSFTRPSTSMMKR